MAETIQPIDYSVNLLAAVLWQYDNATNLQAILRERQAWYTENQEKFWTDWKADVFDLSTANSFGLAVWSIILGMPIYIMAPSGTGETWGFGEFHVNFNRGNFGAGSNATIQLSTEDARTLLRLRAFQIQSAGCVPEINRELAYIFAAERPAPNIPAAFVIDNQDMTCSYIFNFELSSSLQYVMRYFDVLPRPAGVQSNLIINFSGTLVTEDGADNYITEEDPQEDYTEEDGTTVYTAEDGTTPYTTEGDSIAGNYVTDSLIVGVDA